VRGLKWVLENFSKYDIRIVNLSLGGDEDISTHDSEINRLAELLIAKGIVITVAAGNAGDTHSIPPANSPHVITVGGYSDGNSFETGAFGLYHSNYGETIDGYVKPEVIAPAMYVAAPILPDTEDYYAAEALSVIAHTPDYAFRKVFLENWKEAGLAEYILSTDIATARGIVTGELERRKIVATHYQHVDGTSFAAPITASVIAQMLEANPKLTPAMVKNILISTASRVSGHSNVRQGFGVVNARLAVEGAINETHFVGNGVLTPPRLDRGKVAFIFHDDSAKSVYLAGEFNGWDARKTPLANDHDGMWRAEIPIPPSGRYRYKFVIDGNRWIEDPSNGMKEEDGYGGFNSLLNII
jgi:serine protease AprX